MSRTSKWKLVGKLTRNDMRGKDPINKLHSKLLKLVPQGKSVTHFGMSKEALEYFELQLTILAKREGFNAQGTKMAVSMAMLQHAPVEIEGVTGFQVYYKGK